MEHNQLNHSDNEKRIEEVETMLEGKADSLAENFTRVSTVLADFEQFQDYFV